MAAPGTIGRITVTNHVGRGLPAGIHRADATRRSRFACKHRVVCRRATTAPPPPAAAPFHITGAEPDRPGDVRVAESTRPTETHSRSRSTTARGPTTSVSGRPVNGDFDSEQVHSERRVTGPLFEHDLEARGVADRLPTGGVRFLDGM
jgi:hypothetical protein